ncbi:MAG: dephospho-CoA kinase [Canibacter sp.]
MTLIALTGGIGSGKSTIAARLRELGAYTIDSDQLARDAVEAGSTGLAQIKQRFGAEVLQHDGALNRSKLGAIVFNDEAARKDLEAIIHPEVRRLAAADFSRIRDEDENALIVYEIPLLVETNAVAGWDEIVLADASQAVRIERLVIERGMSREEAQRRVEQQATDAERRDVATYVIDTSTTKRSTLEQVNQLWRQLASKRQP